MISTESFSKEWISQRSACQPEDRSEMVALRSSRTALRALRTSCTSAITISSRPRWMPPRLPIWLHVSRTELRISGNSTGKQISMSWKSSARCQVHCNVSGNHRPKHFTTGQRHSKCYSNFPSASHHPEGPMFITFRLQTAKASCTNNIILSPVTAAQRITVPKYSEISNHCGRKVFICFMLAIGIAEKARTAAMDAMEKAPGE